MIDMESLESQVGTALESYMKEVMGAYTGAISKTLESQVTSAVAQIAGQMQSGIQTVMQQAMGQIGTNLQKAYGRCYDDRYRGFCGRIPDEYE